MQHERPRAPFVDGKRILLLTAHPDDETYAAGSLHINAQRGGETMLVCATLGEKGISHLKRPMTARALKTCRKRELLHSARIIGIQKVQTLLTPDGKVKERQVKIYQQTLPLAKKFKPDLVLGFDATGITGHWDHIAISRVGVRIAHKLKLPYFVFAVSPRLQQRAGAWFMARRRATTYVSRLRFTKPQIRIPVNPTVKKKALLAHASQLDSITVYGQYPAWAKKELLGVEYFRKLV